MHYRLATEADLPAIIALLADDQLGKSREDPSLPLDAGYLRAFAAMEADPNQELIVATDNTGAIIGTMQLTYIPSLSHRGRWRANIEAVRIARELRGQGLGAAFFRWAIVRADERGCGLVQLTTNASRAEARRFYERLGFIPSHIGMKLELGGARSAIHDLGTAEA